MRKVAPTLLTGDTFVKAIILIAAACAVGALTITILAYRNWVKNPPPLYVVKERELPNDDARIVWTSEPMSLHLAEELVREFNWRRGGEPFFIYEKYEG